MANIQARRNKDGKLTSFLIRVHRGRDSTGKQLKPYTTTFKVPKNVKWSEKTARKKAADYAANFEKECKEGIRSDTRQTFMSYCDYVINLKEERGILKHSTIVRYKELTRRIYPYIGHIKLKDLRPDNLNDLYTALSADGIGKTKSGKLSPKTILEHHRLISTVLEQALKECLVPFNVAKRAEPPKATKKEVNFYLLDEIKDIRNALERIPIKWRMIIHLFLITGARRGEILGLKWDKVDFKNNSIYICNNILYSTDIGIYESTPKTKQSIRTIFLPNETMQLLKNYKVWQNKEILRLAGYYKNGNYLFTKENGEPMHPDSITNYCTKFSKKFGLPHIHPHGFRHTMATQLLYNGVNIVSTANRLGHAQTSTTLNTYAHAVEIADKNNAEMLSDIFLKQA